MPSVRGPVLDSDARPRDRRRSREASPRPPPPMGLEMRRAAGGACNGRWPPLLLTLLLLSSCPNCPGGDNERRCGRVTSEELAQRTTDQGWALRNVMYADT